MKNLTTTVLALAVVVFWGCGKKPEAERWEEVEFRVALRSEPYESGDAINSGDFEDLILLSIPIQIKSGPGEAHAVKDCVWLHIAWDNLIFYDDMNQLGFEGFRRKIDNRFKSPYGTSWQDNNWQELGDVGISSDWDIFQTPVGIGPSKQDPRIWCKMWRLASPSSQRDIILGQEKGSEQSAAADA